MALENFDQIQEFILGECGRGAAWFLNGFSALCSWLEYVVFSSMTASLYRMVYQQSLSLDKVLPYSSVLERKVRTLFIVPKKVRF